MKKRVVALGLAVAVASVTVVSSASAYINGGWPETCLEMNDMVEASPLGSGAVGIYQQAFGDQAEQACRNDHRDDVRNAFSWAFTDSVPQPSQSSDYSFSGVGDPGGETILDRTMIKGGRYIVSTTQDHCITAILSEGGGPSGIVVANNCSSGTKSVATIPEGSYRLYVLGSNWSIQLQLDE